MLDGVVTRQRATRSTASPAPPLLRRIIHQGYRLGDALMQGLDGPTPIHLCPAELHTVDTTELTPGR